MSVAAPIIEAHGLTKQFEIAEATPGIWGTVKGLFIPRYKPVVAVRDLTLQIPAGQIVGLIGPNGAGKSTTIKMLTGILLPTKGTVRVAGFDPFANRVRYVQQIGVVFGQRTQLWWDLAVRESFALLRRIYRIDAADYAARLQTFDKVFELEKLLDKPVRKLSLGERMRCDLAASLLHNPPVLFLDEPTIGLDVIAKDEIRRFLKSIHQQFRTTVILTTHDLSDIEQLCERVVIINHGQIVFDDGLEQLRNQITGETRLQATLHQPLDTASALPNGIPQIALDGVSFTFTGPNMIEARFQRTAAKSGDVIRRLFDQFEIAEISVKEPEIEEVIKQLYKTRAPLQSEA